MGHEEENRSRKEERIKWRKKWVKTEITKKSRKWDVQDTIEQAEKESDRAVLKLDQMSKNKV